MTLPEPEIVAAVLSGVLAASLAALIALRRNTRRAFEDGLARQADAALGEQRLLQERVDIRGREVTRLEQELKALTREHDELQAEHVRAQAEAAGLRSERDSLRHRQEGLVGELTVEREARRESAARETELRTRLDTTERSFAEKEAVFRESSEALKREFQLLANRIFEEQGATFVKRNQQQLDNVLVPFKEQIHEFKRKVEEVYHTESKDRASLLSEVRNLQQASERINQEAENLTRALKGDKKLQGNWGELVLERVLEESGLRKGHEYSVQMSVKTEDGALKRPDVVIHLPDDKDVVVDAKVSLVAYEQGIAREDDAERDALLRQHVNDLRTQVRRLAEQDYDRAEGVRSLDFVLLFVPVEPAFTVAMERDPSLFTDAFARRIVIVSPTTLMMTLRIIHNVWRYEKQNRNAQEIARRAGAIYDKLRAVVEDMERLGENLRTADNTYQSAVKKLTTGKGNLVRQVEQFRELGATVKKPMPRAIVDNSESE